MFLLCKKQKPLTVFLKKMCWSAAHVVWRWAGLTLALLSLHLLRVIKKTNSHFQETYVICHYMQIFFSLVTTAVRASLHIKPLKFQVAFLIFLTVTNPSEPLVLRPHCEATSGCTIRLSPIMLWAISQWCYRSQTSWLVQCMMKTARLDSGHARVGSLNLPS